MNNCKPNCENLNMLEDNVFHLETAFDEILELSKENEKLLAEAKTLSEQNVKLLEEIKGLQKIIEQQELNLEMMEYQLEGEN